MMTPRFDDVARFDVVGRDSNSLEASAARCFQCPHLRLTGGSLHFQVDPGMRDDQMQFLDHTLNIHECVDVAAMGMVRERGQREGHRTHRCEAKT
jgi:hypothetical protein